MFALYSSENTEEDRGLYFTAGSSLVVNSTLSKLQKKFPLVKEILKIQSDSIIINELKHKLKTNSKLVARKHVIESLDEISNCKTNLIKIIAGLFLECYSSTDSSIRVCQDCKMIVKIKDNKKIGKVLVGKEELISTLVLKKDWVCRECRFPSEFALIAWGLETNIASISNYSIFVGYKSAIQHKLIEIRRGCTDAQVILSIQPAFRDQEVTNYIRHKFFSKKPYQITNDNKVYYQELIIETFLNFFIKNDPRKEKVIRVCKTCCRVFLNKGEKYLGELFLINKEEIKLLDEISPYWDCLSCEKSLLTLYAMEVVDGSLDYYIATNKRDRDSLKYCEKRYVRIYPCFKFLCPHLRGEFFKLRIAQLKHVTVRGNILKTKLPKHELLPMIHNIYYRDFLKLINFCFRICGECGRCFDVFIDSFQHHFGACWHESHQLFSYYQSRTFFCRRHKIGNVLFWNIESCKLVNQLEIDDESIFINAHIICVLGTGNNNEKDITQLRFLRNRLVISEPALMTASGNIIGGLKVLIKKDILFSYEKLSYSSKGLFVKLEHADECTIIGVVLWPLFDEPSDSFVDWLLELENILKTYNKGNTKFILGGNFNCRIGNLNNGFKDETVFWNGKLNIQRNSLDTVVDRRGEQLAELMMKHAFILCNGRTASDFPGKFTCKNENLSVSDLVWVNQNSGLVVRDMSIQKICVKASKWHDAPFLEFINPPD